eukprot:29192-Pelagococcus_subviridis.AAC.6
MVDGTRRSHRVSSLSASADVAPTFSPRRNFAVRNAVRAHDRNVLPLTTSTSPSSSGSSP